MFRRQFSFWRSHLGERLKRYGPLTAIALLLPGGSLVALAWLLWGHRASRPGKLQESDANPRSRLAA
jgi:hypothetical protein